MVQIYGNTHTRWRTCFLWVPFGRLMWKSPYSRIFLASRKQSKYVYNIAFADYAWIFALISGRKVAEAWHYFIMLFAGKTHGLCEKLRGNELRNKQHQICYNYWSITIFRYNMIILMQIIKHLLIRLTKYFTTSSLQ